jgi:DNA gyrase subunit A
VKNTVTHEDGDCYSGDDISMEDMIADEDVVITVSHLDTSSVPLSMSTALRAGRTGCKRQQHPRRRFREHIYVASTHNTFSFSQRKDAASG